LSPDAASDLRVQWAGVIERAVATREMTQFGWPCEGACNVSRCLLGRFDIAFRKLLFFCDTFWKLLCYLIMEKGPIFYFREGTA
jgi:hypothetical protein